MMKTSLIMFFVGAHFRQIPRDYRQLALKSQYCFTCKCEPCTIPELQYFMVIIFLLQTIDLITYVTIKKIYIRDIVINFTFYRKDSML